MLRKAHMDTVPYSWSIWSRAWTRSGLVLVLRSIGPESSACLRPYYGTTLYTLPDFPGGALCGCAWQHEGRVELLVCLGGRLSNGFSLFTLFSCTRSKNGIMLLVKYVPACFTLGQCGNKYYWPWPNNKSRGKSCRKKPRSIPVRGSSPSGESSTLGKVRGKRRRRRTAFSSPFPWPGLSTKGARSHKQCCNWK